jgi:DNA-binding GntR family transcriptional regulator
MSTTNDAGATSTPRVVPLDNPRLVDSALQAIRTSILEGHIAPGERLLEMQLAAELGISRGPLREALHLLEKDGIIFSVPRRGKFVHTFDLKAIDEVYSLRRVLETFAARLAVERMTDEGYERLRLAYQRMGEAAHAENDQRLSREDIAFHRELIELAEHDLLKRAWLENIDGKLQILLNVTTQTHHRLQDALERHKLILEAAGTRDARLMQKVVERHIDQAWKRARSALRD